MQPGLFLLLLMGQCSFSTCQRYEYLFIEERKTWHEARSYCREKYTDLAKVYNMTDMERLKNSAGSSAGAWIGLYSNGGGERKWHWSQPGEVYSENTEKWDEGQPNDVGGHQNCVVMNREQKWFDFHCSRTHGFICYDESSSGTIHFIIEDKTWIEAQSYCREHHTDLVSGDQLETLQNWKSPWIGLFRDTWLWSDESSSSFRHWESFQSGQEQNKCAYLKGSGKWDSDDCSESRSFFCYEGQCSFSIICQYLFIDEKKTWHEAQSYCREKYTDLAKVYNMTDMKILQNSAGSSAGAWIGLYSNGGGERKWHWSQPGEVYSKNTEKWEQGEPNDLGGHENCGVMNKDKKWLDFPCSQKRGFICYDAENMILIQQNLTWDQAVDYCREHHHDLVSITNPEQQRLAEQRAKKASTPYVWLGLRYSCILDLWFWVNDEPVCYHNLAQRMDPDECYHRAAMEKGGNNKWFKRSEIVMYNFICVL